MNFTWSILEYLDPNGVVTGVSDSVVDDVDEVNLVLKIDCLDFIVRWIVFGFQFAAFVVSGHTCIFCRLFFEFLQLSFQAAIFACPAK